MRLKSLQNRRSLAAMSNHEDFCAITSDATSLKLTPLLSMVESSKLYEQKLKY